MPSHDVLRELFITGLVNAHAVEKQALSIMTPQVARIEHYPEVADRLRAHIEETNGQIARLEEILASFETSSSTIKDLGLSMSGSKAGSSAARASAASCDASGTEAQPLPTFSGRRPNNQAAPAPASKAATIAERITVVKARASCST